MRQPGLAAVFAALAALPGCLIPEYQPHLVEKDAFPEIAEFAKGKDKVCVVDVEGIITTHTPKGTLGAEPSMIEEVTKHLRRAAAAPDVKAVVLRVDSPGGEVTASDLLRSEVMRFRLSGKPVVAYFEGIAASGGYYLAAPADWIVIHPTTVTGSIGVIAAFPNIEGLMGKIGVDVKVIKSGAMKDGGSPFHAMDPAAEKVFQGMIDEMYGRFLQVVVDGRRDRKANQDLFTIETLKPIADGRIYTANQALANRLVDQVDHLDKAVVKAAELAGLPTAGGVRAIRYETKSPGLVIQVARTEAPAADGAAEFHLKMPAGVFTRPGFWYLWWPNAN